MEHRLGAWERSAARPKARQLQRIYPRYCCSLCQINDSSAGRGAVLWETDARAAAGVVVTTVLELFFDAAAAFELVLGRERHVAGVEEG